MKDIKPLLDKIANYLKKRPEVIAVYLYGSFAQGFAKDHSDVDIGVLLKSNFEYGPYYIGGLFEEVNKLDNSIEIQTFVINDKSPMFRHKVISPRKILFCRDNNARAEFEVKTMNEYFEYRSFYEMYYECMIDKVEKRLEDVRV